LHVRIRPTELGLKGVLLLCALEVAFLATAYSNLFFLLIVFCCVLGGLGLLWTAGNTRGVQITCFEAPIRAAGEPREVRVVLRSTRRAAAFDLAVKLTTANECIELAHVPRLGGEHALIATLPAQSRSVLTLAGVQVVSRYPFGLFQVTREVALTAELVTHPRPFTPAELAARSGEGDGELGAITGARSNSIAGLRTFRTGDATADIHWKATARRGQPIVKEREHDTGDTVEIVLDRRCDGERFETALSLVTTAVLEACADQRPVQLRSQDFVANLGGARRSPLPILRWLAAAAPLPDDAPPPPRGGAGAVRLPGRRNEEAVDA
jgi:uncharacterized protein (DUF58 family)